MGHWSQNVTPLSALPVLYRFRCRTKIAPLTAHVYSAPPLYGHIRLSRDISSFRVREKELKARSNRRYRTERNGTKPVTSFHFS